MLRGHYIRARGEAEKVRRAIRQQQMTGVRGGSGQGTLDVLVIALGTTSLLNKAHLSLDDDHRTVKLSDCQLHITHHDLSCQHFVDICFIVHDHQRIASAQLALAQSHGHARDSAILCKQSGQTVRCHKLSIVFRPYCRRTNIA